MPRNLPYLVTLEPGTHYWCSRGTSAKEPFCDGSHKGSGLTKRPYLLWREEHAIAWSILGHCRTNLRTNKLNETSYVVDQVNVECVA